MGFASDFTEYEFVLPDGSKRYETVDKNNDMSVMQQISLGMKLHGAVAAYPGNGSLFEEQQVPPQ